MLWRHSPLSKEGGFSLLEMLLGVALLGVVVTSFFLLVGDFASFGARTQVLLEEEAHELLVFMTLLDLIRYGSSPLDFARGERLKVWMGKNPVEVYSLQDALLVKNRGVANPVAILKGLELSFRTFLFDDGRQFVEVELGFRESKGYHLRTLCGEVLGEKIYR